MASSVPAVLRLLATPAHVDILAVLEEGPSYPRAIAERLGRSEGRVQKCLHDLAEAGLVGSAWRHTDRTFKEYRLTATSVRVALRRGVQAHVLR